jgi:hypothetical protein
VNAGDWTAIAVVSICVLWALWRTWRRFSGRGKGGCDNCPK